MVDNIAIVACKAMKLIRASAANQAVSTACSLNQVDNRSCGRARHSLRCAVAVHVACQHPHLQTGLGRTQEMAHRSGTDDIAPACAVKRGLPLVADQAKAIGIDDRVACQQSLPSQSDATDGDRAAGCIVDGADVERQAVGGKRESAARILNRETQAGDIFAMTVQRRRIHQLTGFNGVCVDQLASNDRCSLKR